MHSCTTKLFSFVPLGDFCLTRLSIAHIRMLFGHSAIHIPLFLQYCLYYCPYHIISVQSSAYSLLLTRNIETTPFQEMSGPPPPYTSPYPPQTYSVPFDSQNYRMNDGVDPNALLAAGKIFNPWNISPRTIELILRYCSCCLHNFVWNHIWITPRHHTISNILLQSSIGIISDDVVELDTSRNKRR